MDSFIEKHTEFSLEATMIVLVVVIKEALDVVHIIGDTIVVTIVDPIVDTIVVNVAVLDVVHARR